MLINLARTPRKAKRTAPIYGLKWDRTTDTYIRTGFAGGLNCAVGIDDEVVNNDFDNQRPWAYFEDATDLLGNKFVKIPKVWIKDTIDDNGREIQISSDYFDGAFLSPIFYDYENDKELDYFLYSKYNGYVDGGVMKSISGIAPSHSYNIVNSRTYAEANGDGYQQLDVHAYYVLQCLMYVEFGTFNSQDVVRGYVDGNYSDTHTATVAETDVNRIIVDDGWDYRVGQTISIGTSLGGNQICYGRQITSIDTYDASNQAITFDGDAVDISVGNILYNTGAVTGFSDSLGSSIACVGANDGHTPFVYRGIENPYGNMWQFVDGVNITDNQAWVCNDAREYASNLFASPYVQLSYTNANSNGYITRMGYDESNPTARFPIALGGDYDEAYGDYYYQNTGARIARVGGNWYNGSLAGSSYWFLSHSSSGAYVSVCGRLLKKAT